MRFSLAQLTRRQRNVRRSAIVLRDIVPPAMLATDLYRAVYAPIVAVWSSATDRIAGEYERTLSTMTQDSPADVQREIDDAASEVDRLFIQLDAALRQWALRTETWARGKFIGSVLSATSVDLSTILSPTDVSDTLETAIAWNTSLIRDVNAQIRQRVGNAVFDGLRNRATARDVAKSINEATMLGRKRSQRIAVDQLAKTTSRLAQARSEQAGITEYEWKHSQKLHPRQTHQKRNGKIYKWSEPPADGHPGTAIYCGCRALSRITFD